MKSIDDALELRARIFGAFEMAETEPDEAARRAWLTFVVVGGGPTGVEMAGQIAELSHRALQRNFRRIDPGQARVLLLEGGDGVLTQFGARLSAMTARDLGRLGVEVHTGAMVVGMDGQTVDVRRRRRHDDDDRRPHEGLGGRHDRVAARPAPGRRQRRRDRPDGPGQGAPRLHACPAIPRSSSSAT